MRLRTLLIALLAILFIAFGALSVFWFVAREKFAEGLEAWRQNLAAQGVLIAAGEPEIGGYPLALDATVAAPVVTFPDGLRWEGPASVSGKAWLWDLETVVISAPGHHVVRFERGPLAMEVKDLALTLGFARGQIERIALELAQPTVTNETTQRSLSFDKLAFDVAPLTPGPDRRLEVGYSVELRGLPLPQEAVALTELVGPSIELLQLAGSFRGLVVPGALREMVAAWRDSGGVLDLERIELSWGELWMQGDGTLAVDESYRLLGAFSFDTLGLVELVERAVAAGTLDAKAGETLGRALTALSSGEDEKGRQRVELPITLQDGILYLGQIKVGTLRPLF